MRQIGELKNDRSLAMVAIGGSVRVNCMLFDLVRARCAELGLSVGDTVRVTGLTDTHLLLRTERGAVGLLDRQLARFILIGEAPQARPRASRRAVSRPRLTLVPG